MPLEEGAARAARPCPERRNDVAASRSERTRTEWRKDVLRIEDDPGEEGTRRIGWRGGRFTVAPRDDNAHVYVDEDERWFPSFADVEPEQLYYVEPHAAAGITHPATWGFGDAPAPPESAAFFPPWQDATLHKGKGLTGGEVSIHAEVFSPLSQLIELPDVTEGLVALARDPAKVRDILDLAAAIGDNAPHG